MTRIAFDVHQKTSTYAFLDPASRQPITGHLLTDCASFAKLLGDLPQPSIVALEATRSTPAVCAWLRQLDCEIHLVDPQRLSGLAQARSAKTDRKDALLMLDALTQDYLPEAYLADPQVQLMRGMMARAGKVLAATNLCGAGATEELRQWLAAAEEPYNLLGALYLSLLQQVRLATAAVDEQLKPLAADNPLAQELLSQPGKGLLTTLGMLAEMGDLNRFASVKQLISYAGLAPSVQQSGDKSRTGRLPKHCNKHLRYWAVICAQATVRSKHPSRAKEVYLRVKSRHGANAAKIAAAREIVKDVYYAHRRLHQSSTEAA